MSANKMAKPSRLSRQALYASLKEVMWNLFCRANVMRMLSGKEIGDTQLDYSVIKY